MATPLSVLTEQERAQAMARFGVLQPFLESHVELRQLAQQHQLALRTLRRWVHRYTTEGLAGLVRQRRSDRGRRRRLPTELHQCLEGLALQTLPLSVAVIRLNIRNASLEFSYQRMAAIILLILSGMMSRPALGEWRVGLYDLWEIEVTNPRRYPNPFDFTVIELHATFTAPSGRQVNFFGFHDGDGKGGQTGNVWRLRFSPDESGTWRYTYSWTDGTTGDPGSFEVIDTGLPGPLKVATDNPWYFAMARGAKRVTTSLTLARN